jgi:hypothetical protein
VVIRGLSGCTLGVGLEDRESCIVALRASCSIMSWSTSRAILAAFLFLRYCRCLRSNFLEGCLAKLVGIRDWSRVMVVESTSSDGCGEGVS